MKIGILKADSVLDQFQHEFGDYPAMFRTLVESATAAVSFETFDVEHLEYPEDIDACDAYLITGSKKSVYDDEPWIGKLGEFVLELHHERKKTVGICFGHQLVAQALGGRTEAAPVGWGVGIHRSRVVGSAPWMDPPLDSLNLIVSHKDQVTQVPPGAEVLASSEFCPNAMMVIGDHMLTFQGHPEFCRSYSCTLMNYRRELLGEATFTEGIESLSLPTHEGVIARWIINFIREEE